MHISNEFYLLSKKLFFRRSSFAIVDYIWKTFIVIIRYNSSVSNSFDVKKKETSGH